MVKILGRIFFAVAQMRYFRRLGLEWRYMFGRSQQTDGRILDAGEGKDRINHLVPRPCTDGCAHDQAVPERLP
jgi:hypothetical protein